MLNRLTDGLEFQTQALMLRAERQRLLASNIANADTPGYQAKEINFAQALRRATGSQEALAEPAATQPGHLGQGPNALSGPAGTAERIRAFALQAQTNLDSNGVDMDRERAAFADNTLRFEATMRFVNGQVRGILEAMRSHNAAG